jgi:hypothetical protein
MTKKEKEVRHISTNPLVRIANTLEEILLLFLSIVQKIDFRVIFLHYVSSKDIVKRILKFIILSLASSFVLTTILLMLQIFEYSQRLFLKIMLLKC